MLSAPTVVGTVSIGMAGSVGGSYIGGKAGGWLYDFIY